MKLEQSHDSQDRFPMYLAGMLWLMLYVAFGQAMSHGA